MQEFAVAVDFDDRIDVFEEADHRAMGFDFAKDFHGASEEAGVLAKDRDVAGADDAMHDLMDDGAFA